MALRVAVTGPTGTFGHGLMPLLESDPRIERVVGIARRPFDPQEAGWSKMTYRQGDVREEGGLREVFEGADVVVHLAFLITGGSEQTTRAVNVDGTRNAFRAAAGAGAKRFVYASSVAAYGFHPDNPLGMSEDWPVRPADRLFYAREKAELEQVLAEEARAHPELDLYVLRPPVVVGPHTVGSKLPRPLGPLVEKLLLRRAPAPLPVVVPDLPLQLIHEDDVGTALVQCVVGAGPAGAYNIAGDGVPTLPELAREAGLRPVVTVPGRYAHGLARRLAAVPGLPSTAQWLEAFAAPAVMDTTRARRELGWAPRWSGIDAWRDTLTTSTGRSG